MEDVVEQYRRLALEKENSRLNFDDEEEEVTIPNAKVAEFPVVGVIHTDRKVRFQALQDLFIPLWRPGRGMTVQEIDDKRVMGHSEKFCPLKYVEDLVLEKNFSADLRASGGGKISPTRGGKWLVDKQGGPNHYRRAQGDEEETMRQGRKGSIAETESSGTKEESRSGAGEVSVDQKRRRVWKDPAEENNTEEEMALDNTKNGEETGFN
ncbi:unnamed protein product [Cuscuta epithymum]|uniref:Uncharacterized protein n=1 Tax=Cuscuta epithymum TaxID=186058 RepID=A0AAV0FKW9_9ASTE|nr:unnamed protein product [Cuscuta epithymum]